MEVDGKTLSIESEKHAGINSFCDFIARRLQECVEESGGDFTRLGTDGSDWVSMIIAEYEDGAR